MRQRLSEKKVADLPRLCRSVGLSHNAVSRLVFEDGDVHISYRAFEKLSCALSIAISEILGEAQFEDEKHKAEWVDLYKNTRKAGAATGVAGSTASDEEWIPFATFLALRGVEELAKELQ